MKQLRFCMNTAVDCGKSGHPQDVMRELGFVLIHSLPQSIADQWWFTVEDNDIELPEFLTEMEYDLEKWGYYEELKRKEGEERVALEDDKIAKYELPSGWERFDWKDEKTRVTLSYMKIRDKNDQLIHSYIFATNNSEIRAFDKVTGKFMNTQKED